MRLRVFVNPPERAMRQTATLVEKALELLKQGKHSEAREIIKQAVEAR
ncbi:hypothetical protein Pan181_21240 [Aeoliella mucimassa]|uniref:Uncharacterized protein n=1 Tax=Aeoliella mucimassa TaxID=2527972 RepID=A0A518AMG4_9BACT|nr:hypothetical protein Pan181_21240 [Aeoliella mucimassa]